MPSQMIFFVSHVSSDRIFVFHEKTLSEFPLWLTMEDYLLLCKGSNCSLEQ